MLSAAEFVDFYPLFSGVINQMVVCGYALADQIASFALNNDSFAKFAEFAVKGKEYEEAVGVLEMYYTYLHK